MEVLTDIYRDIRSNEKAVERAYKCHWLRGELRDIYTRDHISGHIAVSIFWVIIMCQFLSIYQLIVFKGFPSTQFTGAEKAGIYALCLIGYPFALLVIALLFVTFVKAFKSALVKKVLITIAGAFVALLILGGVGVVIWRLVESPD